MARSKVKGTNGKPRKAAPKSGKGNRASISIQQLQGTQDTPSGRQGTTTTRVKKRNDGDPHVYTETTKYHGKFDRNDNYTQTKSTKTRTKRKDPKAANPNPGLKGGLFGITTSTKKSEKLTGVSNGKFNKYLGTSPAKQRKEKREDDAHKRKQDVRAAQERRKGKTVSNKDKKFKTYKK